MVDKAKIEFERWTPGSSVDNNLRVCFWNSKNKRFNVIADLQPEKTKILLLGPYSQGCMLFVIEECFTKQRYVAKLIYDLFGHSEASYHLRLNRLAKGKLPNIVRIVSHAKVSSFESGTCLDILILEQGSPFLRHLKSIHHELPEIQDECNLAVAFQMAFSLHFMHENLFQHRDVRLQNFIFSKSDEFPGNKIQYSLDPETTFSIPVRFGSKLTVPLLIDFGISADMTNQDDIDSQAAFVSMFRSPELMFVPETKNVKIERSDDLFALALVWVTMCYKEFSLPKFTDSEMRDMEDAVQLMIVGPLFETLKYYTPREIITQGLFLVSLMGFPPASHSDFYKSVLGSCLFKFKIRIERSENYNFLKKRNIDSPFPQTQRLLHSVLQWNKNDRPLSAHLLLRSQVFDRFRAHQNFALPQCKLYF